MVILRYFLMTILFVPSSLFLAMLNAVVQSIAYVGLLKQIYAMKLGVFL